MPMVVDHARRDVYGDEARLWTLLRFAEEVEAPGDAPSGLRSVRGGVRCQLWPGARPRGRRGAVLATSPLTALLLTSMIEWFTQLHYVEHVRDQAELDELFRDILRFHWIDESRHARMDSLLIDGCANSLPADEHEKAIDELLVLGGAVDGLLAQQAELDIGALRQPPAGRSPRPSGTRSDPPAARVPVDVPRLRARAPELRRDRRATLDRQRRQAR